MTIEEAIKYVEKMAKIGYTENDSDYIKDAVNAAKISLAALRTQQEAEKNEPLTVEELRGMGGMPYYHVSLQGNPNHWAIFDPHYARHIEDYHYGERWLAYRHPPKDEPQ